MKNYWLWAGGIAVLGAAYFYYHKKTQAVIQQDLTNPNASVDNSIGNIIANSTYQGNTGQIGDTVTGNYRYDEYQQYLNQGGAQSGSTFDQFLTAAQGQSLPVNG
jgi:hypothetical protein